jgi:signal transduction histidine kinase
MKLRSVDFTIGSYNNKLIKVDPDRLVEVIQNIIENALKYGDGRRISMDINEEDGKRIVFSIKNTGCTLEKRELANIFESFYRGTNTGKQEGSGLGLYICRRLMHLMDGEIYADIISEDGEDVMKVMLELNI